MDIKELCRHRTKVPCVIRLNMVFACSAERVTKGGVGRATAQFSTQTDHSPFKSSITAKIMSTFSNSVFLLKFS